MEQLLDKERNCSAFLDRCDAVETVSTQSPASSYHNCEEHCAD